jgi:S-formylglutathione hydrolase FrmB
MGTMIGRILSVASIAAAALALSVSPASAQQSVVTLNLQSRYVTPAEAVSGLPASIAATAGPTGLRSWVVLPNNYTPTKCWPVLYLLHAAGTVNEWLDESSVYANLPAIVVIPGGGDSQYTNWWNGGRRNPEWESWFFRELMPTIGTKFPICAQRSAHAIAGSSMGGYGAMYLASQMPGYFGTAASFSGVISISDPVIEDNFATYSAVWGQPGSFYELGHDPVALLPNLAHTRLFVYVGNGEPFDSADVDTGDEAIVEQVMEKEASDFVDAARHRGVTVHFRQHAGIHDQTNWNYSLGEFLASNPFGAVKPSPASWTYLTVSRTGVAWGYQYAFSHSPAAVQTFSFRHGILHVDGSGRVALVTPTGMKISANLPFELNNGTVEKGNKPTTTPGRTQGSSRITMYVDPRVVTRRGVLTLHFEPKHSLGSGQEYEIQMLQWLGRCDVQKTVYFRPRHKLSVYGVRLTPGRSSGHPRNEWCSGHGNVDVEVAPLHHKKTTVGTVLGAIGFRAK